MTPKQGDNFGDFWIAIEGPWLSKHAYYEQAQGCFPSRISRTRKHAIIEIALILSFGIPFCYFVIISAMRMIS